MPLWPRPKGITARTLFVARATRCTAGLFALLTSIRLPSGLTAT